MTLYQIKPAFVQLLRPIAANLVKKRLNANQVTLSALTGSIVVGTLLIMFGNTYPVLFLLMPIWMFLRMALNAIDGIMAKEHNQKSSLGGYLNELSDVIADLFLFLPFAFIAPFSIYSIGTVIILSIISELCGVLAHSIKVERRYDGPLGKSDRALIFGALALWVGLSFPLSHLASYLPWLVSLLILINCYNRIKNALQVEKTQEH
nr:CDP-alcohol phosphatidyltransferase family protein [Thorsellia anophelis]